MTQIVAVDGSPLALESIRMLDYLRTRSAELTASAICERIRAAAAELDNALNGVSEAEARVRPITG